MATCYRHANRETGVSCSNCERPICPDCMTTTPVGMRCPECTRSKTKVHTARSLARDPVVAYVLIAVNVLAFFGQQGTSVANQGVLFGPLVAEGEVWRILTSGFLHDGPFHLMLNMVGLYFLGSMLEPALGPARFAGLYFASLLAGSLGVMVISPESPTLGASGAIYGLLGAALMMERARGVNPMQSWIGTVLILNLAITFLPGFNISIGGHLGGLAGGLVAGYLMDRIKAPRRRGVVLSVLACAAVAAVALAGTLVLAERTIT